MVMVMTAMENSFRPGPSELNFKHMRFLITDKPTDANLATYIEELRRRNVTDVVRVCESPYATEPFAAAAIALHDFAFDDGSPPPQPVVDAWLALLNTRFAADPKCCVAVHCVAGLGRAPVLVALALVELGMKYEEAVEQIRQKRRGAINARQLAYLAQYRPKSRLKLRNRKSCIVA